MSASPPSFPTAPVGSASAAAAARRLLGCSHLAEDAVQDALLALWQLDAPPREVSAWLHTAVVLRARQLRRRLRRRRRHEACAAAACPHVTTCDNPLHHAYAHELEDRVATAVAAMPGTHRAPFRLWTETQADYADLARTLAIPVGTVRSRLHRTRAALAAALPPDERGALHPAGLR